MGSLDHGGRRLQLLPLPLLLLLLLPTAICDLFAARSALLSLRSALGGRTRVLWRPSPIGSNITTTTTTPCSWAGVQCLNDTVVGLRLPGVSLSGQIPPGIFSNLSSLRTLSLRFNSLSGPLPSDLASCLHLRNLYLQGNQFSGEIPAFISSLQNLVRLDLAGNNFNGNVRASLNNLTNLRTLYLEDNQLNGTLPDLKLQLKQFNASNNQLSGTIPVALSSMPVSAFGGNHLCGKPLEICPGIAAGTGEITGAGAERKRKGLSGGAIAGIVVGSLVVFALLLMILVCVCGKKRGEQSRAVEISSLKRTDAEVPVEKMPPGVVENGGYSVAAAAAAAMSGTRNEKAVAAAAAELNGFDGGIKKLVFFGNAQKVFDLEELLRASAEVLGKGTFGTAYKAVLEIGPVVAVKRLKDVTIPEQEFRENIEGVGAMEHENLVSLRAYYYSRDEKLLVYDYMPMGSLSALLHGNKGAGRTPLNWELRAGIALGAARGISYLHSQGPTVSHGNIKASNILLTRSNEARVSDFGLAHLVGPSSTPNRVAGYRAPEVTDPRKVSQKADVYSFGVLLLELLTGKAPTHALLNEEGVDLPRWVQSIVKEEWTSEVFDLELLRYENVEEEMVQLLQLAIDCTSQHPDIRPSMAEVTKRIEELCATSLRPEQEDSLPASLTEADDGSFGS
ncbi:Probable inactive receptor kinase At1g48480 [Dionaea muscipula]